jgi:hypothetical protein
MRRHRLNLAPENSRHRRVGIKKWEDAEKKGTTLVTSERMLERGRPRHSNHEKKRTNEREKRKEKMCRDDEKRKEKEKSRKKKRRKNFLK